MSNHTQHTQTNTLTLASPGNALVCAWCSRIFQRRPVHLACKEAGHTGFPEEAPGWGWLSRLSCRDSTRLDGSPSVWWWALARCLEERTNWPRGIAAEKEKKKSIKQHNILADRLVYLFCTLILNVHYDDFGTPELFKNSYLFWNETKSNLWTNQDLVWPWNLNKSLQKVVWTKGCAEHLVLRQS